MPLFFGLISALVVFNTLLVRPAFAQTSVPPQTATVSATVPEQTFTPAQLRTPENGAITNNPLEPFSFIRASSNNGIASYDLYLDGAIVAGDISDAALGQDAYFYTSNRTGDLIQVILKNNIPDGRHTWFVRSHTTGGASNDSEVWSFYVDSTLPLIILTNVDQNTMFWASYDPSSIPPESSRHLLLKSTSPLLRGKVEAYSNLKISAVCPSGAPTTCQDQSITLNEPTGNWEHRLNNLLPDVEYTVYLIAVDAANNINNFPVFYILFSTGKVPVTPTPTASPSATLTPTQAPTIPPFPTLTIAPPISPTLPPEVRLGDFFRQPPPAPPLPPENQAVPIPVLAFKLLSPYFFTLIVLGLLAHLLMTIYGAQVKVSYLPNFLLTLLLPFLGDKKYRTITDKKKRLKFTTLMVYDPNDIKRIFFYSISNILGQTGLQFPEISNIFIRISRPGYEYQSFLKNIKELNPKVPFILKPKDHLSLPERLETFSLATRIAPLILADATSLVALFLQPSIALLIYFLISIQLTYSEYVYPHLTD